MVTRRWIGDFGGGSLEHPRQWVGAWARPFPLWAEPLKPRQARPGEAQELNQGNAKAGTLEHAQLLRDEVLPLRLLIAHALLELGVGGSLGNRHFEHTPKLAYQVLLRAEEFVALLDELLRLFCASTRPVREARGDQRGERDDDAEPPAD